MRRDKSDSHLLIVVYVQLGKQWVVYLLPLKLMRHCYRWSRMNVYLVLVQMDQSGKWQLSIAVLVMKCHCVSSFNDAPTQLMHSIRRECVVVI